MSQPAAFFWAALAPSAAHWRNAIAGSQPNRGTEASLLGLSRQFAGLGIGTQK
jgi:hypothetical protein